MDRTEYYLKRFSNSQEKDFKEALRIYLRNTEHNIITNAEEITKGLDSYNSKFSDSEFTLLGFYMNETLIGYCQLVYFKSESMVFIDYLVIDEPYRKNSSFYQFIEEIKDYFNSKDYHPLYVVTEVSLQGTKNKNDYAERTRRLIRLLKMSNFGVINSPYYQPMLGVKNYETKLEALLMLFPVSEHHEIMKDTFLKILETIYYKHYGRWYSSLILAEQDSIQYLNHIQELFGEVTNKLKDISTIHINGYKEIFPDKDTPKPKVRPQKMVYYTLGFVGLLLVLAGLSFALKRILGMEYKDQTSFWILTCIGYLFILSNFSDKASVMLNKAFEKWVAK